MNLYKPNQLLESKRVYFEGRSFNLREIILFLSNKFGGIHFDRDKSKYKDWHTKLENAYNYMKLGNPNGHDESKVIDLAEKGGACLVVLPQEIGHEWSCLEIEMLSAAQALLNIYCNRIKLIDGTRWKPDGYSGLSDRLLW